MNGWERMIEQQREEIVRLREDIKQLREEVIAFCAPWAATYARDHGYPDGHLHATHYDILARCGARMDAFKRHVVDIENDAGRGEAPAAKDFSSQ
jgi:hypothetical protein